LVQISFENPMASQIHFSFGISKRMMNDEQPVLNIVANASALLFKEKPNHLRRVLHYSINIVPKFFWNNGPFDIES
jgi:hypothetical protein